MGKQHSPISRRAFLGSIGAKAAVATASGVAAAEWASDASAEDANKPKNNVAAPIMHEAAGRFAAER